jgi:AraC-like DNA-binding protein
MDVLSDVLRAVRLQSAVFFDVRAGERIVAMTPPMSIVGRALMPAAGQVIPFHIMTKGSCWVESVDSGDPPVRFEEGDFLFYPHGHGHVFVTELGERVPPDIEHYGRQDGERLPKVVNMIEDGPANMRFVCGYLGCDTRPFNPLLDALPPQVLAKRPPEGNHVEVDLIAAAVEESGAQRAGGETILARLSELLFVRVIRRVIEQLPEMSESWLSGLRDPQISRVLQLMHGAPARAWTLDELASQSGMSRAILADKFTRCVGETPMRYLARWRMQLAANILSTSILPIEVVAEKVGYMSEAAFNRAFKSIVGVPPGAWRRQKL